ncbi:MAG TPA: purine-nucleoside phosphorylase [Planctomycetota bacterium]|nr:purine-nucleoside phosphorylase [Planctomycetota bacterium]
MVGSTNPVRHGARDIAQVLLERTGLRPRIAMLLGTGHASIANQLKDKVALHGDELPNGTLLASPLLIGLLEGIPVAVADAPLAPYEGSHDGELTLPVRILRALGAETLILTAGAASLSQQLVPGTIAVVEDHINLSGIHPLHGPNDDQLGPRFPDMSEPYAREWIERALEVANGVGIPCLPGVFAAVPGPSLPTRAEYRFLRLIGADLVGMSLVPEVLAAVHCGFQVLALVGITQLVLAGRSPAASIEAMLDAADLAGPRMGSLLVGIVGNLR